MYKEVRGVLGQGKSSHSAVSANAVPSMEALNEMTFSRWVILESMRLRPSAPLLARHVTEDTIIGGVYSTWPCGDTDSLLVYIVGVTVVVPWEREKSSEGTVLVPWERERALK